MERGGFRPALDVREETIRRVLGLFNLQPGIAFSQILNREFGFGCRQRRSRKADALESLHQSIVSGQRNTLFVPSEQSLNRNQVGIAQAMCKQRVPLPAYDRLMERFE